jgi:hypothetical protein
MTVQMHLFVPAVEIVTGVNDTFQVDDGGGNDTCTIAAGTYYVTGFADASDLLQAMADAITASASTAALSPTLEIQNTSNDEKSVNCLLEFGGNVDITWGTFDGSAIGYTSDKSGKDNYDSDTNPNGWYLPSFPAEIVETPVRALGTQFQTVGGQVYTHDRSAQVWDDLVLQFSWIDEAQAKASANTSHPQRTLQRCWGHWRDGRPVRVYSVAYNETTGAPTAPTSGDLVGTYHLGPGDLESLDLQRRAPELPYYSTQPLRWLEYVAK